MNAVSENGGGKMKARATCETFALAIISFAIFSPAPASELDDS